MRRRLLVRLLLATLFIPPIGSAEAPSDRLVLPIEIVGAEGTTASQTLNLDAKQSESAASLWLQVHGVRYPEQASVQINSSPWIRLTNDTVTVAEPGRTYGGIGGGFATLAMMVNLPRDTVVAGSNIIRFRFNKSDGLASGYRVLAWNFLAADGSRLLPSAEFVLDPPERWAPPRPDAASIREGQDLWHTASLVANSLPNSPRIKAHCADCHAQDGRDLKYFNFSNASIVARSRFHGLTTSEGEQIASYIRSLPFPNPGRPWNPPYQPGPGLDQQPISSWAAGAGLTWILDRDTDSLKYLVGPRDPTPTTPDRATDDADVSQLAVQITPELFRPDGNLNVREIPIAMQLPDWSQWLPRIHPKDAWGPAFARSNFARMYDATPDAQSKSSFRPKPSIRQLLAALQAPDSRVRNVIPAFAHWTKARQAFLAHSIKTEKKWSPELTERVYSTQLWQLMKTWEMTQEFGLEGRGHDIFGATAESRTWCNTVPADTAPAMAHIPDAVGVGGGALTNEYLSASWYELQVVLNSGNHQHHDRLPVDWVYLIAQFHDLYVESHQPEPLRLLVAVIKALQSTNSHLGPDNYSEGWRPDRTVDPRIMVSPYWAPFFKPLPFPLHRALTESLLAAWMDKTSHYSIGLYLPVPVFQPHYDLRGYDDITGGKVWKAADRFRAVGVSDDLLERLRNWGITYTDRAAALQYR